MKAVFRHELSSCFTSLSAYIFGAFLLLFCGIFCLVYNLEYAVVNFEYTLGGMSFVYLVIVPILTMRVISEEKRQKTDLLLYSLPLSMWRIVLGKFLALLLVSLIPLLILGFYPLLLSRYGNVNLLACYTALFGFFGLGAALISIGMFVSSLTDSQPVAAGLCFLVMLLNYFMVSLSAYVSSAAFASLLACTVVLVLLFLLLWFMTRSFFFSAMVVLVLEAAMLFLFTITSTPFDGLFPALMRSLSLFERFDQMITGVFDLSSIVYFFSIIGVSLFFTVESLEKRRWGA